MKKFFVAIGWSLLFLLIFFVVQLVVTMVVMMAVIFSDPNFLNMTDPYAFNELTGNLTEAVMQYGSYIVGFSGAIVIPIILLFKPSGQTRREGYRFHWMGLKNLFSVVALVFGVYLLINFIVGNIHWPEAWQKQHNQAVGIAVGGNFIVNLVCVGILGPIAEELVFRGAIYGALRKGMPAAAAMLLQAVLFGIVHGNPIQFIYAFVLGMCLVLVYERANSIWAPITLHMLFNSISVVIAAVGEELFDLWLKQPFVNMALLTGCIVLGILGIAGLLFFNRSSRKKQPA